MKKAELYSEINKLERRNKALESKNAELSRTLRERGPELYALRTRRLMLERQRDAIVRALGAFEAGAEYDFLSEPTKRLWSDLCIAIKITEVGLPVVIPEAKEVDDGCLDQPSGYNYTKELEQKLAQERVTAETRAKNDETTITELRERLFREMERNSALRQTLSQYEGRVTELTQANKHLGDDFGKVLKERNEIRDQLETVEKLAVGLLDADPTRKAEFLASLMAPGKLGGTHGA